MKKWIPTAVHVAATVAAFLTPSVQAYVSMHPGSAVLLGAGWAYVGHLLQSPISK